MAVLNGMCIIFQLLGGACITGSVALLVFQATTTWPMFTKNDSAWFVGNAPLVTGASAVIAFVIAYAFMTIFDVVADTLLYCYLTDDKEGTGRNYAPSQLRDLIAEHGETQAAKKKGGT